MDLDNIDYKLYAGLQAKDTQLQALEQQTLHEFYRAACHQYQKKIS